MTRDYSVAGSLLGNWRLKFFALSGSVYLACCPADVFLMARAAPDNGAAPAVLKAPLLPELSLNEALRKAFAGNPEVQKLAVDSDMAKDRITAAGSRGGPQTKLTGAGLQFIFKKGSLGRDVTPMRA